MERWGYTFPPEWHLGELTASERFAYATFSRLAGLYWLYVRPRLSMAPPKYTRQSSSMTEPADTQRADECRWRRASTAASSEAGPALDPPHLGLYRMALRPVVCRQPAGRRGAPYATTFCLFLGHARSGHSIVGVLLDAHPRIVLADEFDALEYVDARFSKGQILYLSFKIARDQGPAGSA